MTQDPKEVARVVLVALERAEADVKAVAAQRDAYLARLQQYDGEAYDQITAQRDEARAEVERLRKQLDEPVIVAGLVDREAYEQMRAMRDEARRDLAAATTALTYIRVLCDEVQRSPSEYNVAAVATDILSILPTTRWRMTKPAAGADPAATGDDRCESCGDELCSGDCQPAAGDDAGEATP